MLFPITTKSGDETLIDPHTIVNIAGWHEDGHYGSAIHMASGLKIVVALEYNALKAQLARVPHLIVGPEDLHRPPVVPDSMREAIDRAVQHTGL